MSDEDFERNKKKTDEENEKHDEKVKETAMTPTTQEEKVKETTMATSTQEQHSTSALNVEAKQKQHEATTATNSGEGIRKGLSRKATPRRRKAKHQATVGIEQDVADITLKTQDLAETSLSRKKRKSITTTSAEDEKATHVARDPKLSTEAATKPKIEQKAGIAPSPQQQTDHRIVWANNTMHYSKTTVIRKEFIKVKNYKPSEYSFEYFKRNPVKNRYEDVICMDSSRVILKNRAADKDYIHASWVVTPDGQKYICTQGPLEETLEDFWHMTFTERCCVIVMLCSLREGNSEKCFLYYPRNHDEYGKYGMYRVYFKERIPTSTPSLNHMVFFVKNVQERDVFIVHHLSYSNWPDLSAPLDPKPTVTMIEMARTLCNGHPIVVHCSAGIGQSVCFVGVDYIRQKVKNNSDVKMAEMLKELRNQRFQGVQGVIQYMFLHVCVLESFVHDNILPREGKYTEYLNHFVNLLKRYNRRVEMAIARRPSKIRGKNVKT